MADPEKLDQLFGPPKEVTRFFDAKSLKPSEHWLDTDFDAHALAFTVARSAGYDVLGDIKAAISKALHEDLSFEQFRANLEPILKAKGWWGERADGVQLGSPRRLETIYWANVNTARAAGEWEQIQETKEVLPYLLYEISTALHKRELHLSWVGTILPVDDPWWDTHYPPNGWNCQCRVAQISEWEAEQLGYDPKKPKPAPDSPTQSFVNRRTGEVVRVPIGIDPGWANNPGKTRMKNASDFLAGKFLNMSNEARLTATKDLADSWLFRRIQSGEVPYNETPVAAEAVPSNQARGSLAVPFAVLPEDVAAQLDATGRVVRLSVATAKKQLRKRVSKNLLPSVTADDYQKVQTMLDSGQIYSQGALKVVAIMDLGGVLWLAALKRAATAADEIYLTSFRRASPSDITTALKRGSLIRDRKN